VIGTSKARFVALSVAVCSAHHALPTWHLQGYDSSLTEFEKLCVLRCLRTDRVTVGITRYVISVMGERYVQPPTLDYASIYKQSTETTPIVFVLSPGKERRDGLVCHH
jgi:hypothetical protein